jgi:hypothetical protein
MKFDIDFLHKICWVVHFFGLFNTKLKYSVFVREVSFLRIWAHNIELLFLRLYSFYLEDDLDALNSDS